MDYVVSEEEVIHICPDLNIGLYLIVSWECGLKSCSESVYFGLIQSQNKFVKSLTLMKI